MGNLDSAANSKARFAQAFGRALLLGVALFAAPSMAATLGWVHQNVDDAWYQTMGNPTLRWGNLAWVNADAGGVGSGPGVYSRNVQGQTTRVDTATLGLGFHQQGIASVDEFGDLSFQALAADGAGNLVQGLYSRTGGIVGPLALPGQSLADLPSATLVAVGSPTRSHGLTGFSGSYNDGAAAREGIFVSYYRGVDLLVAQGAITPTTLADFGRFGYSGHFEGFGVYAALDRNERRTNLGPDIAFWGYSTFSNGAQNVDSQGIFIHDGMHTLVAAAERYMALPGGLTDEHFQNLQLSPSLSNGRVAFTAQGNLGTRGVYVGSTQGGPAVLVDTQDMGPDGFGRYSDFGGWVAIDGDNVLFTARNDLGELGIFMYSLGQVVTVFDQDDFARLFPNETWTLQSSEDEKLSLPSRA